jgi:hypothetical protein
MYPYVNNNLHYNSQASDIRIQNSAATLQKAGTENIPRLFIYFIFAYVSDLNLFTVMSLCVTVTL